MKKRATNFKHVSTKDAKEIAINDMKQNGEKVLLSVQHHILNQPLITYRCGLFGF